MKVPKQFEGERLDKFVMAHFQVPWTSAHKLIRTKKVFVQMPTTKPANPEKPEEVPSRFVYRDSAYKM